MDKEENPCGPWSSCRVSQVGICELMSCKQGEPVLLLWRSWGVEGHRGRTFAFGLCAPSPRPGPCEGLASTCVKAAVGSPLHHSRVILSSRVFLRVLPPWGMQALWESLGSFGCPPYDLRCNQCFQNLERHGRGPQWPVAPTSWAWQSSLVGIFPACSSASLKSCLPLLGASGMGKALALLVPASVL